ncbi:MAG: cobalt-precorrin-5B (C(1))-methyltransferase CbiD [Candidatus Nitrospinota bacterium M3_3B_026]
MAALRTGYTTGACAAAAVKAALAAMTGGRRPDAVDIPLGTGAREALPVAEVFASGGRGRACVVKDSGDDPDVTNGMQVWAEVFWADEKEIVFEAGEGVGTVTKDGLSVPAGEPAINPGPRRMITAAAREMTDRPVRVRLSIPGGEEVARKTFNPRLGVVGGLSVLGTTGIVRPYSHSAIRESVLLMLKVALAAGRRRIVLAPGNIGAKAAVALLGRGPEDVVEAGNEWGFIIDRAVDNGVEEIVIVGHPGKLAKLAEGQWDTHSKNSPSAVPFVARVAREEAGIDPAPSETTEGIFEALKPGARRILGDAVAERVRRAVEARTGGRLGVRVALVNMKGELIGEG